MPVSGDARNDSPGHCAMYATYTMMDEESHSILGITNVDKRQVGGKSPNMEVFGMRTVIEELQAKGFRIDEMVTDAHSQVPPVLRMYCLTLLFLIRSVTYIKLEHPNPI